MRYDNTKPRRTGLGYFSTDASLVNADGRTKVGKTLNSIRDALLEHMGEPTVMERAIIDMLAIKLLRLQLGAQRAIDNPDKPDNAHWLSWAESARRDIALLGLSPKEADGIIDPLEYARQREAAE